MRVTLFSTFHNSSLRINIKENQIVTIWGRKTIYLTDYQAKRAGRALCGLANCACGGVARARAIDAQGHEYDVIS